MKKSKPKSRVIKRIYRGMFRPKWEDVWVQVEKTLKDWRPTGSSDNRPQWFACNCQQYIFPTEVREHWQRGHFDTPVYQEIELDED